MQMLGVVIAVEDLGSPPQRVRRILSDLRSGPAVH